MSGASLWLKRLLLVISAAYVGLLLVLFALRIGHPHTLEWQEGAMLDQSLRIVRGLPLYVAPSIEFVPQLYSPLYFYLGAGLVGLSAESFVPLRLLSILATLGTMGLLFVFARRETGGLLAPVLAVGFFAASYRLSAAWFDVARVDMLFVFFAFAGTVLAWRCRTIGVALAAGLLFWLAFLTKQQGFAFALAMGISLVMVGRARLALVVVGSFGLLAATSTALLDAATEGWSTWYVFEMAGGHEFFWPMLIGFWTSDLLMPMAPACAVAVALLIDRLRALRSGDPERGSDFWPWLMFLGTCVATSWFSRLHWGGAQNVVIPAYLAIALAWGVGLSEWLRAPEPRATLIGVVAVLQLGWLFYDPRPLVPSDRDVNAGDMLVERISELDGEVWVSWHGFIPEARGEAGLRPPDGRARRDARWGQRGASSSRAVDRAGHRVTELRRHRRRSAVLPARLRALFPAGPLRERRTDASGGSRGRWTARLPGRIRSSICPERPRRMSPTRRRRCADRPAAPGPIGSSARARDEPTDPGARTSRRGPDRAGE